MMINTTSNLFPLCKRR